MFWFCFREENLGNDVSNVQVVGNQVTLAAPMSSSMTSSMMETSLNGSMNASMNASVNASTPNRGKGHKFTFDYAYWSHNRQDSHFADQAKVGLPLEQNSHWAKSESGRQIAELLIH